MQQKSDWEKLDKIKFLILTPIAQLCTRVVVHPASVIKTRMQAGTNYASLRGAFRSITASEGLYGIYKGFTTSLVSPALAPLYFGVFEWSKAQLSSWELSMLQVNFLAGSLASCARQTVAVPSTIVSQHMIMSFKERVGILSTMQKVWKAEGIVGFYRGYLATLLTFVPSSSIMWMVYGSQMDFFSTRNPQMTSHERALSTMWSSFSAGAIAAVLTNPFDVIRTRQQVHENSLRYRDIVRIIYQELGLGGFTRGTSARIVSVAPNQMLLVTFYEVIKIVAAKKEEQTLS
jgi:solute carrier family 25 protein 44